MSVSQVATLINDTLIETLPPRIRVVGEISNLSRRSHWYFSLKDAEAVLKCVAWASKARSFGFDAENGMEVVATGSVQFYGPQGQCQMYVEKMEPVGAGALEMQFRALCEELRGLGYFDPDRKRLLPTFPRQVAVLTSAKGAALQDVLDTMKRRCPAVGIVLVDVLVQGPSAAPQITRALRHLAANHDRLGIDAVLLTRGGGSIEDLWAFNERMVAEALFDFPIPTVAAIGHETDTTIAELVADHRAATPTQAAMALTPDQGELTIQINFQARRLGTQLQHRLRYARQLVDTRAAELGTPTDLVCRAWDWMDGAAEDLHRGMQTRLLHAQTRIAHAAAGLERVRPIRITARRAQDLAVATARLQGAAQHRLRIEHAALDGLKATLAGLDPRSVLHRGYSITQRADGSIVRSTAEVRPGERIETHVGDGVITSDVVDEAVPPSKPRPTSKRKSRRLPTDDSATPPPSPPSPPSQLDLFNSGR